MASGVGTIPIGVSLPLPVPSTRSKIHFTTRRFSLKPGQMNFERESVRNQFTRNTLGGRVTFLPMSSQCWK